MLRQIGSDHRIDQLDRSWECVPVRQLADIVP
jgi:hypothetical protein